MSILPSKWQHSLDAYLGRLSVGERSRLRWLVIGALAIVLGFPVWHVARPLWTQWRVDRALGQAQTAAEAGNYRGLLLSLQRASQLAPGNIQVWQETADYLSDLGLSDAMVAYENLLRLGKSSDEVHRQLALTALRFDQPARARAALRDSAAPDVTYHRLAAAVALRLGEPWTALQELAAARDLDPNDREIRYNLAVLQLTLPEQNVAARRTLLELTHTPDFTVRASIALLRDAARRRDAGSAAQTMRAALPAHLLPVDSADTLVAAFIATLQQRSGSQPDDITVLARWMAEIRRADTCLAWLQSLAEPVRAQSPIQRLTAEIALQVDRLDVALPLVTRGAVGPLPADVGIMALAARQQTLLKQPDRSLATWSDAVTLAGAAPADAPLQTLVRLAFAWRAPAFAEAPLETLHQRHPEDADTRARLIRVYANLGRRPALQAMLDDTLRRFPEDREALLWSVRLAATGSPPAAQLATLRDRLPPASPDDPMGQLCRLIIALQHEQWAAASEAWNDIPPAARTLPEFTLWGAQLAAARGQRAQAREMAVSIQAGSFLIEEQSVLRRLQRG